MTIAGWRGKELRRFERHNRSVFRHAKNDAGREAEVLFEVNNMHSAHIAYSYLANVLAAHHGAAIKGYTTEVSRSRLGLLKVWVKRIVGYAEFGVYRSFGTSEFIAPTLNRSQRARARGLVANILASIQSKRDVECISIDDVWIGDLVYDSYLRAYAKPTIVLGASDFQKSLRHSVELFVFWQDYLDRHDVRAINVSHTVYNNAVPLRIAVARGIPVYQVNLTHCYRLGKEHLFAYADFKTFREQFLALPESEREAGIAEAQQRIMRRLGGEVGVDMAYSSKSAYGDVRQSRLIRQSPKRKVLIAAHCFFDSPHSYGANLFPDFLDWLEWLGQVSTTTDYDWYIKTHPDFLPGNEAIIESLVSQYPKITVLPSDSSHHQLIAEGIDVALTVYGTIGFEYAALGVPVINASLNNPHIAYDFNVHPRDVEHYREILLTLDTLPVSIDRKQVYEYYFMAFIHNTQNLFLHDYNATVRVLGGYAKQFTPAVYEMWMSAWSPQLHEEKTSTLLAFIESGAFRMKASATSTKSTAPTVRVADYAT